MSNSIHTAKMICLTHESAALYWRAVRERKLSVPTPQEDLSALPSCVATRQQLARIDLSALGVTFCSNGITAGYSLVADTKTHQMSAAPLGLSLPLGEIVPLHVLVPHQSRRNARACFVTHLASAKLPKGSLYRISDELLVTSPELTILQLFNTAHTLPCIELICEWCGSYALAPWGAGLCSDCIPITDVGRIGAFLDEVGPLRGKRKLLKFLVWASERLASPRETEVYLMLILPPQLGGYGLERPYVNQQIPILGGPYEKLTTYKYFVADLLWPEKMLIVEYDGFEDHERTTQQIAADKERRSILAVMGYTVITINKHDVKSRALLERKVAQIALALGQTVDMDQPEGVHDIRVEAARNALFLWLLNPSHEHIPFGMGYV